MDKERKGKEGEGVVDSRKMMERIKAESIEAIFVDEKLV